MIFLPPRPPLLQARATRDRLSSAAKAGKLSEQEHVKARDLTFIRSDALRRGDIVAAFVEVRQDSCTISNDSQKHIERLPRV